MLQTPLDTNRSVCECLDSDRWCTVLQGVGDGLADRDQDVVSVVPLDAVPICPPAQQPPKPDQLARTDQLDVQLDDLRNRQISCAAGDEIAGPHRGAQAVGHLAQQIVAEVVAERVVDALETRANRPPDGRT